jgi:hypothetical protein
MTRGTFSEVEGTYLKIAMLDPEEKFESPKTDPNPKALPQKEELALM